MNGHPRSVYQFGEFHLDPGRRLLTRGDGEPIALTGKAFDALVYLVEHAGELVTRPTLTEALWPSTVVEENNLSQAISVLRRALGDGYITTVARRGYQFTAAVHTIPAESAANGAAPPPGMGFIDSPPARDRPFAAGRQLSRRARRPLPPSARRPGLRRVAPPPIALIAAGVSGIAFAAAAIWLTPGSREDASSDPLHGVVFTKLTEFEGAEEQAAISRDGRLVAFLRERDGVQDVWIGHVGTGDFYNLTRGVMPELRNPAVRTLGFSPDGSHVVIWNKTVGSRETGLVDGGWMVPAVGGDPRPFLKGIAELDWSPDGTRIVYHTADSGDPLYVARAGEKDRGRLIHVAPEGVHCHFPLWSRDGEFVYFVRGFVPDEMDVWRTRVSGGVPERLTFSDSRVSYPIQLDDRTLLYLATAKDGSGPWLHALDLERRTSRRLSTSGQAYTSLAASADGRRIVATEARSMSSLWHVPLRDGIADASGAKRLEIPTPRGSSPRLAPGFVVYRAPKAGTDGIWKLAEGAATELWSGAEGRVTAGPALTPDGERLTFVVQKHGRTRLYVMNADGSSVRRIADGLELRGAPAWSPDGEWIAIGAMEGTASGLFKIPLEGDPVRLVDGYAVDPAWSPGGDFLVFSGADVGTNFQVGAVDADGTPHVLPALQLSRGSRRLDFIGEDQLVLLRGNLSQKELWVVDLTRGIERQLTALGPGPVIRDFDISDDGRELVFDRVAEESDVVLIDLPLADTN